MLNLPPTIMKVLMPFAPLFHTQTWRKVPIVLIGTILTPGKRTVTAALRVMGLKDESKFSLFQHVLNRASWSSLMVSKGLLGLLITLIYPTDESLVFGIDETIERRWGETIAARGIYRDPVRSSESHFVKASGLRWISLMLLTPIPWAQRIWALPVMTALAPSARFFETRGRKPKTLTERGQQLIKQLRRWVPNRTVVIVGDNSYAALDLLAMCQTLPDPVTVVTRLRLDAALYEPAPPYPGMGRPPRKGARLSTPQAYTDAVDTVWTTVSVRWYDGQVCEMELASATAVWFHYGKPLVPLRGGWCVTHWVSMKRRVGSVPTKPLLRSRLSSGLSCVGKSKSPMKKPGGILALKLSANGRIKLSRGLRPPCWGCSLGLPWLLMCFTYPASWSLFVSRLGTPNHCQPSRMR